MCGVFGFIKFRDNVSLDMQALLKRMGDLLAHRGPDGFNVFLQPSFGVGIRRLAIVDLENGNQPVFSRDKRFGLVLNGEIYNYRELRKDLESKGVSFTSASDSEVLLHALVEYGLDKTLMKINGMFAFVFFDTHTRHIILVRDRLGVKPLYYTIINENYLLFASEWKAFYADPTFHPSINDTAMGQVFRYGFPLEPSTIVKEVQAVLPAHAVFFNPGIEGQMKYWDIPISPEVEVKAPSIDTCSEHFSDLFESALKMRIPNDSNFVSYLSSGLDSTAVAGVLKKRLHVSNLSTLSLGFFDKELDERGIAEKTSAFYNTSHTDFEMPYHADDIEAMIWHLEAPYSTLLFAPLYYLSKKTNALGIKVAINGDGSDELLGGYDYFKLLKLQQLRKSFPSNKRNLWLFKKVRPLLTDDQLLQYNFFLDCQLGMNPPGMPFLPYGFLTVIPKNYLYAGGERFFKHEEVPSLFDPKALGGLSPLNQAFYTERHFRLLNLTLPLNDKLSMSHSVETRSPFLDYRLWEAFSFMPVHYRISGLKEKFLLRKAMRDIYPPWIRRITKKPLNASPQMFVQAGWEKFEYLLTGEKTNLLQYFNPETVALARKDFLQHFQMKTVSGMSSYLLLVLVVHLFDELFIQKRHQRTMVS